MKSRPVIAKLIHADVQETTARGAAVRRRPWSPARKLRSRSSAGDKVSSKPPSVWNVLREIARFTAVALGRHE